MITAPALLLALLPIPGAFAASATLPVEPSEEIPFHYDCDDPVAARAQWEEDQRLLERYGEYAAVAVTGTIINVARGNPKDGPHQVVSILVSRRLRGKAPLVYDIRVDPAPTQDGRPAPQLIVGYDVLAFVDRSGWLLDGDALFAMEAGWAWRNRRPGTFFKPRLNQDWVEVMDPHDDYLAWSLEEVAEELHPSRPRALARSRR